VKFAADPALEVRVSADEISIDVSRAIVVSCAIVVSWPDASRAEEGAWARANDAPRRPTVSMQATGK
jgi:hypothetical protein